ncbi:DUF3108 domain-containing protein [Ekhidna sp. To15]|uniref:DUF3108 domain-containing protein n=1 Tax=Ekhidna sp. To15 TaxID=3395267 RepID=UPI003F523D73
MKNYCLIILALLCACQNPEKDAKPKVEWLGQEVDFNRIQSGINTYHMFDSTQTKVGSMIFGTYFENGKLVSRDTSSFDDGSVYEDAEFTVDTNRFKMEAVSVNMQINTTKLDVDLDANNNTVTGLYRVIRDTTINDYPVDSTYNYDVFRSELYMLMQTLDYKAGDTIRFKALISTSMTVADASIYYVKDEQVTTAAGTFDCTVIHLMTDGKMPQNRIWISKEKPAKIVKFYVPGPELSIELVDSRKL